MVFRADVKQPPSMADTPAPHQPCQDSQPRARRAGGYPCLLRNPFSTSPLHFAWVGSVLDFRKSVERWVLGEPWSGWGHNPPSMGMAEIWNAQIAIN